MPGLVGGFIPSGAWGRSGGGREGGGILAASKALPPCPPNNDVGRLGSGLFGGSDGELGLMGVSLSGGGLLGGDVFSDIVCGLSFDIGDGGIARVSPFPSQAPVSGRASCSYSPSSFSISRPAFITIRVPPGRGRRLV